MLNTQFLLASTRSIEPRTSPLPALADTWVRVRFMYCGICGSDLSMFEGRRRLEYPRSIGHEFVGLVVQVGGRVEDLEVGDLVSSDLNHRCRTCDQCRAGRSHLCRLGQVGLFSNRGFAIFGDLEMGYLFRMGGQPSPHLCLVEPLSCAMHASDWARPAPGERVLVVGAGGIGLCIAFLLARSRPAIPFEITDVSPVRPMSIVRAALGTARYLAEPSGEYDVVFDVSGAESGLRAACNYVKPGGRLCSMSQIDEETEARFLLGALTRRDVSFKLSYLNGERQTLRHAAELLGSRWTPVWNSTIEIRPLADIQSAFEGRRSSGACKTVLAQTLGF